MASYIAQQRAARQQSNAQKRTSQQAEKKRKYEKAVAAGVDPKQAAFAFDYTPEGTTDVTVIQTKTGSSVTARSNVNGRIITQQADAGSEYAIPTDEAGRSYTDAAVSARKNPIYDYGRLTYAGPAERYSATNKAAVAYNVPLYPIDFPVYGNPYAARPARDLRAGYSPNNPLVPDFIERPARDFVSGARETFRNPRGFSERFGAVSGAERLGMTAGIVGGIGFYGRAPQGIAALRSLGPLTSSYVGTTGAILGSTGIAFALPELSSRTFIGGQDRRLLADPRFNIAYEAGRTARSQSLSVGQRYFIDVIPGAGEYVTDLATGGRSREAFEQGFAQAARELGLPNDSLRVARAEFRARGRGGTGGIILAQLPGEVMARAVSLGSGLIRGPGWRAAISTLPAGALEGALTYGVEREASRQPIELRDLGISSLIGAGTASTLSFVIAGSAASANRISRAFGRGVELGAYSIDPPEIAGDLLADVVGGPQTRYAPLTIANPNDFVNSRIWDVPTESYTVERETYAPGVSSSSTTRSNDRSMVALSEIMGGTRSSTRSQPRRGRSPITQDFVGVPVQSTPMVPNTPRSQVIPVAANPFLPTVSRPQLPAITNPLAWDPVPTTPYSWSNPFSRTQANPFTFTPVITGWSLPPDFWGGGGRGRGNRGAGRRRVKNLPSLTAAFRSGFNPLKAFKAISGKQFSGIELRGFI